MFLFILARTVLLFSGDVIVLSCLFCVLTVLLLSKFYLLVAAMSCPALSGTFIDIPAKIFIDPSQSHLVLLSQFASALRL